MVIVMSILCLLPIIIFIFHFYNYSISQSPNDWGIFGNYFSGLLNPIIGIFNIVVLVIISFYIAKWDDDRHKTEFIHKAYSALGLEIDKINIQTISIDQLIYLERFIKSFSFNNLFLFTREQEQIFQELMGSISASVSILRIEKETEETIAKESITIPIEDKLGKEIAKAFATKMKNTELKNKFDEYEFNKQMVMGFFQRVMSGGDYKSYSSTKIEEVKRKIFK